MEVTLKGEYFISSGIDLPEMMTQLNQIEYENLSDLAEKLEKAIKFWASLGVTSLKFNE